jgi:hypothetical protein
MRTIRRLEDRLLDDGEWSVAALVRFFGFYGSVPSRRGIMNKAG